MYARALCSRRSVAPKESSMSRDLPFCNSLCRFNSLRRCDCSLTSFQGGPRKRVNAARKWQRTSVYWAMMMNTTFEVKHSTLSTLNTVKGTTQMGYLLYRHHLLGEESIALRMNGDHIDEAATMSRPTAARLARTEAETTMHTRVQVAKRRQTARRATTHTV